MVFGAFSTTLGVDVVTKVLVGIVTRSTTYVRSKAMFLEAFSSLRGKVFSTIEPLEELIATRKPWSLVLAEAFTGRVPYLI